MYNRNSSFFISVIGFLPGFLVKTQSFLRLSTLLVSLAPSLFYVRLQLPRAWNRLIKTQQNHTSTSRPFHPIHAIGTVFLLSKYALREKLNPERHKFFHPIILLFFEYSVRSRYDSNSISKTISTKSVISGFKITSTPSKTRNQNGICRSRKMKNFQPGPEKAIF